MDAAHPNIAYDSKRTKWRNDELRKAGYTKDENQRYAHWRKKS